MVLLWSAEVLWHIFSHFVTVCTCNELIHFASEESLLVFCHFVGFFFPMREDCWFWLTHLTLLENPGFKSQNLFTIVCHNTKYNRKQKNMIAPKMHSLMNHWYARWDTISFKILRFCLCMFVWISPSTSLWMNGCANVVCVPVHVVYVCTWGSRNPLWESKRHVLRPRQYPGQH